MNPNIIHAEARDGLTLKIIQDEGPPHPRKDWDNVGTIVHWHRHYDFGERITNPYEWMEGLVSSHLPENLDDLDDLDEEERRRIVGDLMDKHFVTLPLALLDHSGLHMWVGRGHHACDPGGWDSGQVGFIYCSLEKALHEWGVAGQEHLGWDGEASYTRKPDGSPRTLREAARAYLEGEVETYDDYLQGNCWGYMIEDEAGNHLDSCWGYLGDWDAEYGALSEGRAALEHIAARQVGNGSNI